MAKEVRLPQLGQTMQEAIILSCLVKPGDEVKKGDYIFEFETDKATLEMESPADGFVKHILVETDQTISVGAPLLVLGGKDEQVPQGFIDSLKAAAPAVKAEPAEPKSPPADMPIAAVRGGKSIPLTKTQKLIAQRMLKSKREIPCFYLTVKVDVTNLVELRTELNKTTNVKITYNDFFIKVVAVGLQKYPIMTGQMAGDTIQLPETINIGLAVSTQNGLVVPVVKDVGKKNVKQIATDTSALIEKAQNEKLSLTDLEGACITISNLGAFGVDSFIPIVIPGQCSIIGVGRIIDTCVPEDSSIVIRKSTSMTLAVDHRVTNGAYAAQFLDFTRKLLEDPSVFA
jgi:pyruvate dehydrogenase E2 component (dihydrolipoamide acetyltransferase)